MADDAAVKSGLITLFKRWLLDKSVGSSNWNKGYIMVDDHVYQNQVEELAEEVLNMIEMMAAIKRKNL